MVWELAAGGFRDTSRVAASDTRMFMDILMTNRPAILGQLDHYIAELTALRELLAANQETTLAAHLSGSQTRRAQWTPRR
jgi:prephenate dehydrogenase